MRRARVVTVGAYERDNFGDVLFSILTRAYLSGADVVAGSIFPATMSDGTAVKRYSDLLEQETWDAVWIVGGEIGSVRVDDAIQMSMDRPTRREFVARSDAERSVGARELTGLDREQPAYLPDLRSYPRNASATLLVNSVGISSLGILGDEELSAVFARNLSAASGIVVRDELSLSYAESQGLPARLGPDMVHALPLIEGYRPDQLTRPRSERYLLVQLSSELGSNFRLEAIAREIAAQSRALDADIVLFAAGTTYSHDDLGQYGALAVLLAQGLDLRRVVILRERSPRRLVEYLAAAELWIGSSLHGRIVAAAYGVPRVSLQNQKVSSYVASWDPDYPAGVAPDDISAAIDAALVGPSGATLARENVSALADRNTRALAELIP